MNHDKLTMKMEMEYLDSLRSDEKLLPGEWYSSDKSTRLCFGLSRVTTASRIHSLTMRVRRSYIHEYIVLIGVAPDTHTPRIYKFSSLPEAFFMAKKSGGVLMRRVFSDTPVGYSKWKHIPLRAWPVKNYPATVQRFV